MPTQEPQETITIYTKEEFLRALLCLFLHVRVDDRTLDDEEYEENTREWVEFSKQPINFADCYCLHFDCDGVSLDVNVFDDHVAWGGDYYYNSTDLNRLAPQLWKYIRNCVGLHNFIVSGDAESFEVGWDEVSKEHFIAQLRARFPSIPFQDTGRFKVGRLNMEFEENDFCYDKKHNKAHLKHKFNYKEANIGRAIEFLEQEFAKYPITF